MVPLAGVGVLDSVTDAVAELGPHTSASNAAAAARAPRVRARNPAELIELGLQLPILPLGEFGLLLFGILR